ncbi:proline--tRNA ligase [Rickettsiales bacterium]|nr:proline--tRNA ligase [Rickettsiales bacterium]
MRLSRYFLPIIKENPAEAKIVSHRLMLRAGMVRQLTSGIYNWLPLGLAVLKNIEEIVRQEMNKAGAIEIMMPTMQPAELWQESGRYDDYGKEMLRVTDRHERDMLYGPTHEEVVSDLFRNNVRSYKDLPMNLYQIHWKFRDEIRPRFGVMRGREFLMKDSYSFDLDTESSMQTYAVMYEAYLKIFKRMGLTAIPVRADNGAIGGDASHEFQILADTGESEVYYDKKFEELMGRGDVDIDAMRKLYAAADEMHDPENCPVSKEDLCSKRGIEVGHIFNFGTKYSAAMNVKVQNSDGKEVFPQMGSYGIGVSRLVGAIIESSHDDNGIIWPESVTPFDIGLINIKTNDEECTKATDDLYEKLSNAGVKVLYDDTKESAGKKFANMDLIGLPWQIAIGPRSLKSGTVELKNRATGQKEDLSFDAVLNRFS